MADYWRGAALGEDYTFDVTNEVYFRECEEGEGLERVKGNGVGR